MRYVLFPVPQLKRYCQVAEYIVILRNDFGFTGFSSEVDSNQDGRDNDGENHNSKNDTNDHSNTRSCNIICINGYKTVNIMITFFFFTFIVVCMYFSSFLFFGRPMFVCFVFCVCCHHGQINKVYILLHRSSCPSKLCFFYSVCYRL